MWQHRLLITALPKQRQDGLVYNSEFEVSQSYTVSSWEWRRRGRGGEGEGKGKKEGEGDRESGGG